MRAPVERVGRPLSKIGVWGVMYLNRAAATDGIDVNAGQDAAASR
jgi:hypothetical protein